MIRYNSARITYHSSTPFQWMGLNWYQCITSAVHSVGIYIDMLRFHILNERHNYMPWRRIPKDIVLGTGLYVSPPLNKQWGLSWMVHTLWHMELSYIYPGRGILSSASVLLIRWWCWQQKGNKREEQEGASISWSGILGALQSSCIATQWKGPFKSQAKQKMPEPTKKPGKDNWRWNKRMLLE